MAAELLAARNPLFGTTNILVIGVPDGWRLLDGYAAPEVDRWTEYRERRWLSQGQAVYRLVEVHPERPGLVRCEVELSVTAGPAGVSLGGAGAASAGGGARPAGRAGLAPAGATPWAAGLAGATPCAVGGHTGQVSYVTVRKGFFPWRIVPAMALEWTCPETRRRVRMVWNLLPGQGEPADLERLLAPLAAGVTCH